MEIRFFGRTFFSDPDGLGRALLLLSFPFGIQPRFVGEPQTFALSGGGGRGHGSRGIILIGGHGAGVVAAAAAAGLKARLAGVVVDSLRPPGPPSAPFDLSLAAGSD